MDVKTLCLGVLTYGDASGYEIRQYFEKGPFSHFYQASYGSIYPALASALGEALVTCRTEVQERRPDKKVYALTDVGMAYLQSQLQQPPSRDKLRSETLVTLLFSALIDPAHLERVYDDYSSAFTQNADMLRNMTGDGVPESRVFVREFGVAFYQSMATFLDDNRDRFLGAVTAEKAALSSHCDDGDLA